jgi:hypothetical protein
LAVIPALPGSATAAPANKVTQIAQDGFGEKTNDYAWSMAWFKGKLYVGTARNEECMERLTTQFYYPTRNAYPGASTSGVTCPPDQNDLDLRVQIWQWSPLAGTWKMVYESPADVPNPADPSKPLARDIGFRGMVVYNNQLYIGANTVNEVVPSVAATNPPQLLRTSDGTHFTPVAAAPPNINNPTGNQVPMGYRAMAVYKNRLFVTVIHALTGDGVVMEVKNPASAHPTFTQISPPTLQAYELQVFNGALYLGTADATNGYAVYKTYAATAKPRWIPVVMKGAGRGPAVTSVVSMGVFQNKLYVGASGWYNTALPVSELIRINRNGKFDLVAGRARSTPQGYKKPISGLPDGFGNPFNAHFWRQSTFRNAFFVGTNDWSYAWGDFPVIGNLLRPGYGFDLWGTCDGKYWWAETSNAFGTSQYNFGARTLQSTPYGFMIGSANHNEGTSIIRDTYLRPCKTASKKKANGTADTGTTDTGTTSVNPATALTSTAAADGTKLTWTGQTGAVSYQILRANYVTTDAVNVVKPPMINGLPLGELPDPTQFNTTAPISVPLAYTQIGTSTSPSFTDTTATPGTSYLYEVVAVGSNGSVSAPSNVTGAPQS